jgi:eukaryotic-like serine/threonine-protein kinase
MPLMNTTFPAAGDYYKAVQSPARTFTVEKLQKAEFVYDTLGPSLARGTSAVVFQAKVDDKQQALRCYIRNDASSRDRYSALGSYLSGHNLAPYVEGATWLDAAIRVNGNTWPVLTMTWIDGRTLNEYVDFLVNESNTDALSMLAVKWRDLISLMQRDEFAHCDLQHGNVMVDQSGGFRLVDYDGVWIPQLAGKPAPTESGHPNYQHPGQQNGWGRWFDTFSALVIYLSLVALSKNTELWPELYNSKNLLFSRGDFVAPFNTQVWQLLTAMGDKEVSTLVQQLQRCCAPGWVSLQSLEMTLDATPKVEPVRATPQLEARWWEAKPGAPVQAPPPWTIPSQTPAPMPTAAQQAAAAGAALPKPPPLSAPLGETGLTKPRPIIIKAATPAQDSWWAAKGQVPTPPVPPAPTPTPPAPAAPATPAQRQQKQIAGSIAIAVGIVFVLTGAINHHAAGGVVLLIIGLVGAAWGAWRLVSLDPKTTNPPGPPGPPGPGARPY